MVKWILTYYKDYKKIEENIEGDTTLLTELISKGLLDKNKTVLFDFDVEYIEEDNNIKKFIADDSRTVPLQFKISRRELSSILTKLNFICDSEHPLIAIETIFHENKLQIGFSAKNNLVSGLKIIEGEVSNPKSTRTIIKIADLRNALKNINPTVKTLTFTENIEDRIIDIDGQEISTILQIGDNKPLFKINNIDKYTGTKDVISPLQLKGIYLANKQVLQDKSRPQMSGLHISYDKCIGLNTNACYIIQNLNQFAGFEIPGFFPKTTFDTVEKMIGLSKDYVNLWKFDNVILVFNKDTFVKSKYLTVPEDFPQVEIIKKAITEEITSCIIPSDKKEFQKILKTHPKTLESFECKVTAKGIMEFKSIPRDRNGVVSKIPISDMGNYSIGDTIKIPPFKLAEISEAFPLDESIIISYDKSNMVLVVQGNLSKNWITLLQGEYEDEEEEEVSDP